MRVFALTLVAAVATLLGACSGGNPNSGLMLPSTGSSFQALHCPQSGALRGTTCSTDGDGPRVAVPADESAIEALHCPQSGSLRGITCATNGAAPRSGIPGADVAQNIQCRRSTAAKDPVCTDGGTHPRSTVTRVDPALRIIDHCDQRATALEPCKPPQNTVITRP
jgi:hypothetical protein